MSPQILEDAFRRVDFDRELVYQFFITFSLFEKALKDFGFRQVLRNDDIQPDWESYATTIDGQFTSILNSPNHHELITAVNYFLNHPPKKQVFQNAHIRLSQTRRSQGMSDSVWLSVLIRRVRNNLFHGGKFSYDRPRDTLLLQFSLIILEVWANCHPDIQQFFLNIQ